MPLKTLLLPLVLLSTAALATAAQAKRSDLIVEGGDSDERASARLLYWNRQTDSAAGQFAIDYGRPVWKKVYENPAQFDAMTKGKVWRMGSNFWTTLDTQLFLNIAGRDVPPGYYYLALHRSTDGSQWSLAFLDPHAVRSRHLDGFEMPKFPVAFKVPMSIAKPGASVEKLTITLSHPKDDIRSATLKVAWGTLALSAPIKVMVGK